MVDPATVTAAIGAASAAVGLIDRIADQIERFVTRRSEPNVPKEYRMQISRDGDAIVAREHGKVIQRIEAADLQRLPAADLRHIQVLETSMENHYAVWAAVYPQLALAVDLVAKARTEQQLKSIIAAMSTDLNEILGFLEKAGLYLDDHYLHVRNVVSSVAAMEV